MKLLVAEDSRRLRDTLKQGLEQESYAVDVAADGEEAMDFCRSYSYDVVILDLMMPRLDGYGVIRQLRETGDGTHILVLSAKDQVPDRISALDMGADDFLLKPFAFEELLSRIRALVRRRYGHKSPCLDIDGLSLDLSAKTVRHNGALVPLSHFEYQCFEYLALQQGRVISREQIIERLHDANDEFQSNVVEVLIYALRKKLRAAGFPDLIQTKRGYGYYIA